MKIFLFSGSHWDREWYQPFQEYRIRLVSMIDELINLLENHPEFGVFNFDGHTIVLEDYLQIRPENKERLTSLIRNGKCSIGPWYCMPDEFLVSGESLIKNLQKGFSVSRSFGVEPLKFGYLCDIFGHISQMPQILSGFGIKNALVGRGTNDYNTPMHFSWVAPDKSSVKTFKLENENGYTGLYNIVKTFLDKTEIPEDCLKEKIKEYIDKEIKRSNIPVLMLMDSNDHSHCHFELTYIKKLIEELYPEADVYNTNLTEFFNAVDSYGELPQKSGELAETTKIRGGYAFLLTNTLSSRYPIKKRNDSIQVYLEKIIEPMYALGMINEPRSLIEIANEYLLKNHPHDSICGCGIDAVYHDMEYRFNQVENICNELMSKFIYKSFTEKTDTDRLIVKIYNPLPYDDERVINLRIDFPGDYKATYSDGFNYETINSFKIYDAKGTEIPYGIKKIERNRISRYFDMEFKEHLDFYYVSIYLHLKASAFTELAVVPEYNAAVRYNQRMICNEYGAENEYISLSVNSDGLLNIVDKQTGAEYKNLLATVDDSEFGDGWNHYSFVKDIVTVGTSALIERSVNNVNTVSFKITQYLSVPEKAVYDCGSIKRSENRSVLKVEHTISLCMGEKWVRVSTVVENNADDHRIRLKIPTGIVSDRYKVNQTFCFIERSCGTDVKSQDWHECEKLEKNMSGIVFKNDGNKGFSFISLHGLHECGVEKNGDIYITLLRSFSKTQFTNGESDGQMHGSYSYNYLLMPTSANTDLSELQRRQDIMAVGEKSITYSSDEIKEHESAFKISGNGIVYSTMTPGDNCSFLRFYNDSDKQTVAKIIVPENISQIQLVDFDNNPIGSPIEFNKTVAIKAEPWKIYTLMMN